MALVALLRGSGMSSVLSGIESLGGLQTEAQQALSTAETRAAQAFSIIVFELALIAALLAFLAYKSKRG